ncbi:hypothetical protein [Paraburkholderia tropica]|uniref:hypothetical protein n=1 Tax=Paraburkholderia tropica TaxID=92647 RepID=UPI0031D7686B
MTRASLTAFLTCAAAAALAGTLAAPASADTSFEGRITPLPTPVVSAPVVAPASAPAIVQANAASAPAPAPQKTASAQAPRNKVKKRRPTPVTAAARSRAVALDDTPFSFRGIALGVTLTELREANTVRATPHESALVCETDVAGGDIGMPFKSYASLTIACRWAHRTPQGWTPSHAVVDGVPASDHVLRFAHESAGEPLRLYEMSFVVDAATAFDLRDLLASRYGAPRMAGDPSLPLLEWDNASSTITICLMPNGGHATLTYLLKPASPRAKGIERALKISQFDEG